MSHPSPAPVRRQRLKAMVAAIAAMLIWSSTPVIAKIALTLFPPLTIVALRYFAGSLLLFAIIFRQPGARAAIKSIPRRTWLTLAVTGVCAYTIGSGTLHYGLKYIPATLGGFSDAIIPVLVFIASIFILKEYPSRTQTAGMIAAMIGGFFFITQGNADFQSPPIGYIFLAISIAGFVVFNILSRLTARSQKVDTLTRTAIPLFVGGGVLIVLALIVDGLPRFTPWGVFILFWLTVFNTVLGYSLFNYSLGSLTALQVNAIMSLTPLSTALIARVTLNEVLTFWQYVAMAAVMIGVVLVQTGHRPPAEPPADTH